MGMILAERKQLASPLCCSLLLLFCVLLISSCFDAGEAQKLVDEEVEALKKIGSKLRKKWDFSADPCSGTAGWLEFTGSIHVANNVTCQCNATSDICHVTSIWLKGQNLTGVLPEEFANLTFLRDIDLTWNYLNGSIPAAWATLPLIHLSLLGNQISGPIPPELGRMITLEELVLNNNQLQGSIPPALGNLINLSRFLVSANNLTGVLPDSLSKLRNITCFRIDGNPISGKIPRFIGNWTKLSRL